MPLRTSHAVRWLTTTTHTLASTICAHANAIVARPTELAETADALRHVARMTPQVTAVMGHALATQEDDADTISDFSNAVPQNLPANNPG